MRLGAVFHSRPNRMANGGALVPREEWGQRFCGSMIMEDLYPLGRGGTGRTFCRRCCWVSRAEAGKGQWGAGRRGGGQQSVWGPGMSGGAVGQWAWNGGHEGRGFPVVFGGLFAHWLPFPCSHAPCFSKLTGWWWLGYLATQGAQPHSVRFGDTVFVHQKLPPLVPHENTKKTERERENLCLIMLYISSCQPSSRITYFFQLSFPRIWNHHFSAIWR